MTLTSPACPAAESLQWQVKEVVENVPGISSATIDLVWDPPWDWETLPSAVKLELGMM